MLFYFSYNILSNEIIVVFTFTKYKKFDFCHYHTLKIPQKKTTRLGVAFTGITFYQYIIFLETTLSFSKVIFTINPAVVLFK